MIVDISPSLKVELLPERAVYWPDKKTLVIADLHWGKTEFFQQHGIPVPSNILDTELNRLLELAKRTRAERVLVLGDLIHSPNSLTLSVLKQVREFFEKRTFEMVLVEGNHDRNLELPKDWHIEVVKEPYCEGSMAFCHHPGVELPVREKNSYRWSGHLHPTLALVQGKDRLRLPCFIIGKSQAILPAFSDFTRGVTHSVENPRAERFFAIADREIIEI